MMFPLPQINCEPNAVIVAGGTGFVVTITPGVMQVHPFGSVIATV
jgi:hypothetical protein